MGKAYTQEEREELRLKNVEKRFLKKMDLKISVLKN